MFIKNIKSDNYSAPRNGKRLIRYIVIHYTGMQSERVSIRRLCNKNSKVSSHYLIGKKNVQIYFHLKIIYLKKNQANMQ